MTVGIVVVSHSAALAAAAGELAAEMAGDQLRMALAGGVDDPEAPLGTDAVKVMQAIEEVDSEAGVMVLMDLGSAVLSAEMAKDLLPPDTAGRVVLCEAPIVEGLIAAAVQAAAGAPIEEVVAEARNGLSAKASHLGVELATGAGADLTQEERTTAEPGAGEEPLTATMVVPNALGFHARPAARIVEALAPLQARVELTNVTSGRGPVSARSLNALITLGARQGDALALEAVGPQAAQALSALDALARDNLGDPAGPAGASQAGRDVVSPAARTVGAGSVPAAPAGPPTAPGGVLTGLPAAPGLAVGPVHHLGSGRLTDLDGLLARAPGTGSRGPAAEHADLDEALSSARARFRSAHAALAARAGDDAAELVGTQVLLLDDPALLDPTRAAIDDGVAAPVAWRAAVREVMRAYAEVEDAYLAERAGDLDAIGREVLAALVGYEHSDTAASGVVVAEDLSPAQTARLDPTTVAAVITAAGSPTAHAALIARALGLPAVVAIGAGVLELPDGLEVIVDGGAGTVESAPDAARLHAAHDEVAERARIHEDLRVAAAGPAMTTDGTRVEVRANVGLPRDAEQAATEGADGVGLMRSEFLFLDRSAAPDEDEQVATYAAVCTALDGRPVTLRTLDVGGDKPLAYVEQPAEANPFLGVRGIRLSLHDRALFATQLRAALRVAAEHPLELLVPMVATLEEIATVRELVDQARDALLEERVAVPERLRLGVMVEIPALALKAEHVVGAVDLVSIGTNDLTQYAMAAERGNPALAGLSDPLDPGVLALIARVGAAAADTDTPVAVCGELASDPAVAALLLGLGVTELSVPPVDVPAVKQAVRRTTLSEARHLAQRALCCASAAEVRALLR